jgi:hypothetical protein
MNGRIVCSEQEILNWTNNLGQLPLRIAQQLELIAPQRVQLKALKTELRQLQTNQEAPCAQKIDALTAQLTALELPAKISNQEARLESHEDELAQLRPKLASVSADLLPIEQDINLCKAFIAIKTNQAMIEAQTAVQYQHQQSVNTYRSQLDQSLIQCNRLQDQIRQAQQSLSHLERLEAEDRAEHERQRMHQHYLNHQDDFQHDHHHGHHERFAHHHHHHVSRPASFFDVFVQVGDFIVDSHRHAEMTRLQQELASLSGQINQGHTQQFHLQTQLNQHTQMVSVATNQVNQAQSALRGFSPSHVHDATHESIPLLKKRLAERQSQQQPLKMSQAKLQHDIDVHASSVYKIQQIIHNLKASLAENKQHAVEFQHNHNVEDLKTQLDVARNHKQTVAKKHNALTQAITDIELEIYHVNRAMQELQEQLAKLKENHFLMKLVNHPDLLFNELVLSLRMYIVKNPHTQNLFSFEDFQPANQTVEARAHLANLETVIRSIESYHPEGVDANNLILQRRQYYQLLGFVHTMIAELASDSANKLLIEKLQSALGRYGLDQAVCRTEFSQLNLPRLSQPTLFDEEEQAFNAAKSDFESALNQAHHVGFEALKTQGDKLIKSVCEAKTSLEQSGVHTKDIKYLTTTLRRATALTKKPDDTNLQFHFKHLIQFNHQGQPSVAKKLAGVMMSFLGVALIGASVAAKVLTLGLATPITTAGIVAGSALVLGGLGLFKKGMRSDFSKSQEQFYQASVRHKVTTVNKRSPLLFSVDANHDTISQPSGFVPGGPTVAEEGRASPSAPEFYL